MYYICLRYLSYINKMIFHLLSAFLPKYVYYFIFF
jgi:hypothetical protein